MENQEKNYEQDDWKIALLSEFIAALTGSEIEKENANQEVGYYYQCCAPASLYKYYSDDELHLNTVKHNQMWYSAPCNFNDVFDCDISIDDKKVFNEALKLFPDKRGVRPGSSMWKQLEHNIYEQLRYLRTVFDQLRNTMGVSCFSEWNNSLLMWAHYANNHRGICVEYDLMEIHNVLKFTPIPVTYSEDRTCFNFFDPESLQKDTFKLFIQSLASKSPEWSYEKEWRIILADDFCGDKWNADKKGALLKMIRPSSITLGCAAKSEFEQKVKDYCLFNEINLYKMEKDTRQYCLNKKVVLKFDKED